MLGTRRTQRWVMDMGSWERGGLWIWHKAARAAKAVSVGTILAFGVLGFQYEPLKKKWYAILTVNLGQNNSGPLDLCVF